MQPYDADQPAIPSEEIPTSPVMTAMTPFAPPFDAYIAPAPVISRVPCPWWRPAAIIIVVLLLLGTGLGLGLMFARSNASTAQATNTTEVIATASGATTLPATVQDLQQTIITVTQRVQASVVEVTSTSSVGTAIGSGEFLTKDGYIVTNAHVVTGYSSFTVTLANGTTQAAQLIGTDAQDDLAVLKIAVTNAMPITFADSSQAQIGEFVLALGTPLGLQNTTTLGIVSAVNRTEQESATSSAGTTSAGAVLTGLVQTSAAINPGNSGGALVDLAGHLVGIPTLGATTVAGESVSGIGFAIPANRVVYVVAQLIKSGHLTSTNQGFLGVQGQDASSQGGLSATTGVQVRGFAQDTAGASPAQAAGIQMGDVITAINGQPIAANTDIAGAVLTKIPGTVITVTVQRGTNQLTLKVTLGERPVQ